MQGWCTILSHIGLVFSVRSSNLGEVAYCAGLFVTQWEKTRDSESISFCPLGPTEYIHSHREFGQPSLWSTGETTNNLEVPTIAMDKSSKWTYWQNQLWATTESWLAYPPILYGGCIPKVSRANPKSDQMRDTATFRIWNKVWRQESESKSNIGTLWTSQQKCIPWSSDDITHKQMVSTLWTFLSSSKPILQRAQGYQWEDLPLGFQVSFTCPMWIQRANSQPTTT